MKMHDDYLLQLNKIKCSPNRGNLLSFEEMTERMAQLNKSLVETNWITDEIERQERRIRLKIAYLMMVKAFKELYNIDVNTKYDELVEKQPLIDYGRKLQDEANSNMDILLKENPRRVHEYAILQIPPKTPINEIRKIYPRILNEFEKNVDEKMDSGLFEDKDVVDYSTIILLLESSYNNLQNAAYKMELDDALIQNFNPNQSSKYISNSFADITYIPEKKYVQAADGSRKLPAFIAKNSNGDEIIIIQTGDLGYGRFRQSSGKVTFINPYELKEYTIIKKYSEPEVESFRKELANSPENNVIWDDAENGEVFTVYGNIDTKLLTQKTTATEYIRYNNDVLLSTSNLEAAIRHNGGYIGEIDLDPETREYIVVHDRDKICLAIDFQDIKRKRKEEGKPTMGVPYKVSVNDKRKDRREER